MNIFGFNSNKNLDMISFDSSFRSIKDRRVERKTLYMNVTLCMLYLHNYASKLKKKLKE